MARPLRCSTSGWARAPPTTCAAASRSSRSRAEAFRTVPMNAIDFSVLARGDYPALIAKGLVTMLELTLFAWLLAMALGTLLALIRMTNSRVARMAVAGWVEYHQNVPMLVQVFLWYFGIATLLPKEMQFWINRHAGEFIFAVIAIGLAMSAYISEDLRGGIRAISKSQIE